MMNCIYCNKNLPLIDSHVISKFIRKRLTGISRGSKGTKYEFRWIGQPKSTQDLPKPKLMCTTCDGSFDSERRVAHIIIPQGDVAERTSWTALPLHFRDLPVLLGGKPIKVGEYQLIDDADDHALDQFSILTAWRALHAMAVAKDPGPVNFLQSTDGMRTNSAAIHFLKTSTSNNHTFFEYQANFYFLGPYGASTVTGANDAMPFAWTFLQGTQQGGIAVVLGYWMIVWPLLPDRDPRRNVRELLQLAFIDWHASLFGQYRTSPF